MDAVILSLLGALVIMMVRTLVELMRFRGTAEALLQKHSDRIEKLTKTVDELDCRKRATCTERRVAI